MIFLLIIFFLLLLPCFMVLVLNESRQGCARKILICNLSSFAPFLFARKPYAVKSNKSKPEKLLFFVTFYSRVYRVFAEVIKSKTIEYFSNDANTRLASTNSHSKTFGAQ